MIIKQTQIALLHFTNVGVPEDMMNKRVIYFSSHRWIVMIAGDLQSLTVGEGKHAHTENTVFVWILFWVESHGLSDSCEALDNAIRKCDSLNVQQRLYFKGNFYQRWNSNRIYCQFIQSAKCEFLDNSWVHFVELSPNIF